MHKFIRIFLKTLGIACAVIIVLLATVYFGSKLLGFRKQVESPVYGPSRQWIFSARFFDAGGRLKDTDTLVLRTYNERFLLMQNKVTWTMDKNGERFEEITGLVETRTELWIHPPRFKGYVEFTEYTPFPEIRHPAEAGKTWNGSVLLGSYATEKTGARLEKEYTIEHIDTLSAAPFLREIHISGKGSCGLGTYMNTVVFSEKDGFTSVHYTKPDGQTLLLELVATQEME